MNRRTKCRCVMPRGAELIVMLAACGFLSAPALAVALPPMNPAAHSNIHASTHGNFEIVLWTDDEILSSYPYYDSHWGTINERGASVEVDRQFRHAGGATLRMQAKAESDFGVNKVFVSRTGAVPASRYSEYGSVPATQFGWDRMIDHWDWSGSHGAYDSFMGGWVYFPSNFDFQYDPNGGLVFGQYDPSGNFVQTMTHGVRQHSDASRWGNTYFLLPHEMPVVSVSRSYMAHVYAYSRWENIFYFAPLPGASGTGGIASFTVRLDGEYNTDLGEYTFVARDWENKDTWCWEASCLGYTSEWFSGNGRIDQLITLNVPFTYNMPQYVKVELWANLPAEGYIDLFNTAQIVNVHVPAHTAVYSYGHYLANTGLGFTVTGGRSGHGLPGGAGRYFSGLGGGPTPPIPEPSTYMMLLAGLGLVGWMARRRRSV